MEPMESPNFLEHAELLDENTPHYLNAFHKYLIQHNMSPNTITAYIYSVRHFFTYFGQLNSNNVSLYKVYLLDHYQPCLLYTSLNGHLTVIFEPEQILVILYPLITAVSYTHLDVYKRQELARRLSGPLGIPVNTSILKRTRKTAPQKSLDSGGRLKNLEQAFTASVLPSGMKNIILVDDIYTTGSTIEACTRALRKAGAEHVYFVTIFIGHGQ